VFFLELPISIGFGFSVIFITAGYPTWTRFTMWLKVKAKQ